MSNINPDSESESLSALSEVSESFLNVSEHLKVGRPSNSSKKIGGRPKGAKLSGVDARDKTHGRTALHRAAARGNLEKMKDLVEGRGATIDVIDNAGVTPLHDACTNGRVDAVRYLLAAGATVSPKDCEGDYPLLDAAQNDNEQICQILLDAGANPTMQNSKGMSALSEAEEGPLKDLLRRYSSRFDSPGQNRMRITDVLSADDTPRGKDASMSSVRERAARAGRYNIDLKGAREVDIHGRDQLHRYVLEREDDLVEQYLEIQDCDYQDKYGDTPLHAAARSNNAHVCGLLLQHDARVDVKNNEGDTALHSSCYNAHSRKVIMALLDAGASSLTMNARKETPLDIANAHLGVESAEARLLQKILTAERAAMEERDRRRALRRDRAGSQSGSARSTPLQSPTVPRHPDPIPAVAPAKISKRTRDAHIKTTYQDSTPTPTDAPIDTAISIAATVPPPIVSPTQQIVTSAIPTTQFLTELKSNRSVSQIDSSIRGSPLPIAPPYIPGATTENHDFRSPASLEVVNPHATRNVPPSSHSSEAAKRSLNGDCRSVDPSPKRTRTSPSHDKVATAIIGATNGTSAAEDATTTALKQMSRDIVGAIEKQNELLASMLRSINALVADLRK